MSATINMKLTTVGAAAVWNAQGTGVQATLTHVQIGTGHRTPDGSEVGLIAPSQTTTIAAGSKPSATQIRVACLFPGASSYDFSEIGIWFGNPSSGGTLFAYYSVPSGKIGTMVAGTDFVFAHEWTMAAATAAAITILADTGQSAMLAMMAAHEGSADPHPQYATDAALAALLGTASPLMDGVASIGTSSRYSREDHRHPSDSAKVSRSGDTIAGQLASTKSNANPANSANYAWKSGGSYGGGWVLQDGSDNLALYSVGGDLCFGFGVDGAIAAKSYIAKTGEGYFGARVIARDTTEAQLVARTTGVPDVYLFNNSAAWGLYTSPAAGGALVNYDRATGKRYIGGLDTSTLVVSNGATYSISINGSAYYATSAGNAGTLAGMGAGYYTDIPSRLGFTPIQQGTGTGQGSNAVKIGWGGPWLLLQIDNTNFGNTWPINITGNAASAGNADTVDGYHAADLWRRDAVSLSAGAIGYIVYPPDALGRRYCIQWGYFSAGDGDRNITFPVAFTLCFGAFESGWGGSAWPEVSKRYILNVTGSGFTASLGGTGLEGGYWKAHGYI